MLSQRLRFAVNLLITVSSASALHAQGTLSEYQNAHDLHSKVKNLVVNVPGPAHWIDDTHDFWYAHSVKGGSEYMLVAADSGTKKIAFDHQKLAAAISQATGQHYDATTLPFQSGLPQDRGSHHENSLGQTSPLKFVDDERTIEFGISGSRYSCGLQAYTCKKTGPIDGQDDHNHHSSENPAPLSPVLDNALNPGLEGSGGNPRDGIAWRSPSASDDDAYSQEEEDSRFGHRPQPCARPSQGQQHESEQRSAHISMGGQFPGQQPSQEPETCASFDGKWLAFIKDFNVFLKPVGKGDEMRLSFDGSENNYYSFRSIAWSPDSKKLVVYQTRPGFDREITYIESSPRDQLQPRHMNLEYQKPGDPVDIANPVLFDIATHQGTQIDNALFPNPYDIETALWWNDSRGFTFEYNQRGHQAYKVIEVNANTAQPRALIDEEVPTFFYYSDLGPGLSAGRKFFYAVEDGKELIWASERDGWEHLYLYDGHTGQLKNQITKGNWLVREVVHVDEAKRQIWFTAGGSINGQDPYFTQYYRINFDGTGLTRLTDADGMHSAVFSKDYKYYIDTWERVDLAPVAQLRASGELKVVLDLGKTDTSALLAAGFNFPEVFVAKGRDGKTDIWGTITRPLHFDPTKKYPVIEDIYAGPQGSFVPKTFSSLAPDQALAELGFIVVNIDGMGTSNRSKAFHDVAWKNLGDAGFADRILWHKAAAAKYPYYDITRVGIFGTSAGGQSSMGAMLFHPEFYKVAVTNSGCHDNRMDKMWWNEQWMGYPIGPQYAASSNVDNAPKLQGHVLIVIGELDTNVDPASSLQVVNALVQAHKHFDMLYIPGQNHGVGILFNQHYLEDYFVHYLLHQEPPDWNKVSLGEPKNEETTTAK